MSLNPCAQLPLPEDGGVEDTTEDDADEDGAGGHHNRHGMAGWDGMGKAGVLSEDGDSSDGDTKRHDQQVSQFIRVCML